MRNRRSFLIFIGFYLFINVGLYFLNPYSSLWHYQDHNPHQPVAVELPEDDFIGIAKIEKTLNEIDLAYNAREPNNLEKAQRWGARLAQLIFFPSTACLALKSFIGYLGPANPAQQAFTLSVKKRYNHLVKIGKPKGLQKSGFLFVEEPSLSKNNGEPY